MAILSVEELTGVIRTRLERDPGLQDVWVRGEVSNATRSAGGHWYFTLKDPTAALRCVMFRKQASLAHDVPRDGASMTCHGAIAVYAPQGQYQLVADFLESAGRGDLYAEFERLKARLLAEGLFDVALKRRPPRFPTRIGVVTSKDAAALRDIRTALARRWPLAELVLAHTPVQGDEAPGGIVEALHALARQRVDVILVARGGGSIEDLWAFNNEGVARAIRTSPVPVVAGIGHETDFTIADLAADVRAATPTAAAELATPDADEVRQSLDVAASRARRSLDLRTRRAALDLDHLRRRLSSAAPDARLSRRRDGVALSRARLDRALDARLRLLASNLEGATGRLRSLGPQATLDRGYAHVRRTLDMATVMAPADVSPGSGLMIRVAGGAFEADATHVPARSDTPTGAP